MHNNTTLSRVTRPAAVLGCLFLASAGEEVVLQPRYGQPVPGLTADQLQRFVAGLAAFDQNLLESEGLGPAFNDISCRGCHNQPIIGGFSTRTVTRFGKAATGGAPFDPLANLGGSLLQEQAISIPCEESVPPEADVVVERLTPQTFGVGLIEAIVDADIVARAMNQPAGLDGQVHWVDPLEGGPSIPGRFGWKGNVGTVLSFSGDAALNEMGLTNRLVQEENAPNGDQAVLAACDNVADPEDIPDADGVFMIEKFTDFQRFLAPPPQTPRSGTTGAAVFEAVGCADCHLSTEYVTRPGLEDALSNIAITPYSDFLIHDMGALGDGIVTGAADEQRMMTRSLWGMSGRISLLHDGRATGGTFADNARDAIAEHDGEGAAARDAFGLLSINEQELLIVFLASLGQVEFDWEDDNDVDFIDWFFLEPFFLGPQPTLSPDVPEALADVDQDDDLDLVDFGYLQRAFTGEL